MNGHVCATCGGYKARRVAVNCQSCRVASERMTPDRFWSRVDASGDCWLWTGGQARGGYGLVRLDGRHLLVHRYVYRLLVGEIPPGLTLDHLCRVPWCVNPDHLEPVSMAENNRRGFGLAAMNARRAGCVNGHGPFDSTDASGVRRCRTCARERTARYRARLAAA